MLRELTPVATAALPIAALKEHLRLASGFGLVADQDALLESYLRAAIAVIENRIGKALLDRSCQLRLSHWLGEEQPLPLAPVSEITEITVFDATGASTLWGASNYRLIPDVYRPKIAGKLPDIPQGGHVLINFEAGFGALWSAVPADLRQAVLYLAAEFYENRHSAGEALALPKAIAQLLEPWRSIRILGGARG